MNISINNISFEYASTVLDNISFTIDSGSFVGILGPNGSGKTTLLRIITKILKPSAGTVFIDKDEIESLNTKEIAKRIGVVSQESSVYPFSAYEFVLMGRTPHLSRFQKEADKDFKIVEDVMKLTNTWKFRDRAITELSGGEKQKVIIARALAQKPEVLILDEPTVHLDINHQIEILDIVKELSTRDITVISVFHDLNMAAKYSDLLIVLNKGKIAFAGSVEAVLTPKNIKEVFGVEVSVNRHPITNSIYVIPHSTKKIQQIDKRIHIIGGGGDSSELMHALSGYHITAGVLNAIDTDYETAKSLGIEIVAEAPFSSITKQAYEKNIEYIKNSDVVVLGNILFGKGNLNNLRACFKAKKLIIVEKTPIETRDFTEGEATELYNKLKNKAIIVKDCKECLRILNRSQ